MAAAGIGGNGHGRAIELIQAPEDAAHQDVAIGQQSGEVIVADGGRMHVGI